MAGPCISNNSVESSIAFELDWVFIKPMFYCSQSHITYLKNVDRQSKTKFALPNTDELAISHEY